jgi:hypothetical protein
LLAHDIKVARRKHLDDVTFAQKYYYEKTGRILNLDEPKTFDEKLWWLKIHYRNPLQTICADKYGVRDYVNSCGGEKLLNELYAVYESADEIDIKQLPDEFFLKTTHGCGANYRCHNKDTFPFKKVKKKLARNLKQNYYYHSREWPYFNIKPRIIAEKVLKPVNPPELYDYRFLCFGGVCKYVFVDIGTCSPDGHHVPNPKRNVYNSDGNLLNVKVTRDNFVADENVIPDNFIEMRDWAELLSKPFPFVRVDLYSFDGIIRFGEMTFYHAGGVNFIEPENFEYELGNCIKLPEDEFVYPDPMGDQTLA